MSIVAKNITKFYGTQLVLDDVNFHIGKGEVVGLLGPNGAGKSTLMKILTCFIPPTSGEAFVAEKSVLFEPDEVKKRIGYLPENNPLYVEMYIKEYLEFVAGIHRLGQGVMKRVNEIVEITGLGPEQHKKIGMLSKGYRQRVGLAQALIHNPEVLILDEPTSGLDPNQLLEIRQLIREIGKEKTVLLSTHIMQEVEAVCSRAIIINLGKIVADAATGNLQELNARDMVSVEFAENVTVEALQSVPGVVQAIRSGERLWKIQSKPGVDVRAGISRFAAANHLTLLSLKREEHNLEKVFQELTAKKD